MGHQTPPSELKFSVDPMFGRYKAQLAWASILSIATVATICGAILLICLIFQKSFLSAPPQAGTMVFGFLFITALGSIAFIALVVFNGLKRRDDPYRFLPFSEKYFSMSHADFQRLLVLIKNEIPEMKLGASDTDRFSATFIRDYEAPEPPFTNATRLTRRVTIEALLTNSQWEGRIRAEPVYRFVFHDGANISRVAIQVVASSLGIPIRPNPG